MKLLVLDSSGLVASVALIEDDQLIAEYTTGNKLTHSQTLLPMLDEVIKRTSFEIEDIDAVAVAKGPGSFTGLRIGAATAKGLGLALDKPIIPVPTVDGLAYQLGSQFSPHIVKGSFITYIGTNPENLDYAKERMLEKVFRLKTEFVGSKELQEAKDKLLGHYIIGQETNLDKATTIGWFETSGRGYKFDDQYAQLINSVTESDIIEVANKVFTDNYVLSVVKPQ